MRLFRVFFIFTLFYFTVNASAEDSLRGYFAIMQVQVSDLQKDASLVGMTKDKILEVAKEQIRSYRLSVSEDRKKPALVFKITTVDVGPHIVSHISLNLKEPGRLPRLKDPLFLSSWSAGTMVSSQPMKHEAIVLKAVKELLEKFAKESLE